MITIREWLFTMKILGRSLINRKIQVRRRL